VQKRRKPFQHSKARCQSLESRELEAFGNPQLGPKLWNLGKKRLLAFQTLTPKFGTPREKILSTFHSSWPKHGMSREKILSALHSLWSSYGMPIKEILSAFETSTPKFGALRAFFFGWFKVRLRAKDG